METSRRQASTTTSGDKAREITPLFCCSSYFCLTFICLLFPLYVISVERIGGKEGCYVELFIDSISVSTTDQRFGLVAKSPVSNCYISLKTIQSSVFRGDKVISDGFRQNVTFDQMYKSSATVVDFNSVVMNSGVIAGVVWDFRVEVVAAITTDVRQGFLDVKCGDIPVKFTVDPAGRLVNGSLFGNISRCDYSYRDNF